MHRLICFIFCAAGLLAAASVTAQDDAPDTTTAPRILAAGDGETLWVVQRLGDGEFQLLHRNGSAEAGEIHKAVKSKGRPVALAAAQGTAYLVYADGTMQSVRFLVDPATQLPAYDVKQMPPLPEAARFVALAAAPRSPFVLMRMDRSVDEAAADEPDAQPAENQPTDESPDAAPDADAHADTDDATPAQPAGPFALYQHQGGDWQPAVNTMPDLDRAAQPRLALVGSANQPHLIVPADNGSVLTVHRYDGQRWHAAVHARKVSPRFTVVNPMNLCVVVDRLSETQFSCTILRNGAALAGGSIAVPPVTPGHAAVTSYRGHPTVVTAAASDERLIISTRDLTDPPDADSASQDLAITTWPKPPVNREMIMFALVVIMCVFAIATWRRDPKTTIVELPDHLLPAEPTRRIIAGVIDLFPAFLVATLILFAIDPSQVTNVWAAAPGDLSTMLPGMIATMLFVLHTGITETLTGTSLGKKLMGLHVVTNNGQPPNIWQVLVRNVLKIVELTVWFLLLFMFLNPARQRIGDLAARTVVVRKADNDAPADENDNQQPD